MPEQVAAVIRIASRWPSEAISGNLDTGAEAAAFHGLNDAGKMSRCSQPNRPPETGGWLTSVWNFGK
jgi:hypothetical protein